MENLGKKIGYLKGLMEGVDFSDDPSRGKLFAAMAELIGDLVDRVESLEELVDDLNDYVESIDDDLSVLEGESDDFHAPDDEDDEYEDAYYDDVESIEDQLHLLGGKADHDAANPRALVGNICAECGRMFFTDADDPEDARYDCPHCGKRVRKAPLTPENTPIVQRVED